VTDGRIYRSYTLGPNEHIPFVGAVFLVFGQCEPVDEHRPMVIAGSMSFILPVARSIVLDPNLT
jgi:hypothetical protein